MVKEDTRGQKLILQENKQTINFYSIMAGSSMAFHLLMTVMFFFDSFTLRYQIFTFIILIMFGSSIGFMNYAARPVYSSSGQLVDGGVDLNMKDGYAEHVKDLIIWTTICQTLTLFSNYFWLLFLVIPARVSYLIWIHILAPYIFQPAPEVDLEAEDKKSRKRDRQMRRMQ